ncbi:MAG: hypothetical protein IIC18_05980 [Bacteroidetes bacterium]|nr:hypothetical protein [Bacteroidota bacterium]
MLNQNFREFVGLLNEHEVRYLIVGGHAVAAHGHPRYTDDLDVWVECTPENARLLIQVLDDFGFSSLGLAENDFSEPDNVIQLGFPPQRIDLLTGLSGVSFKECYPARERFQHNGLTLAIIGLECLRKNKKAVGRHQDLGDLENLE